MRVTVTGVINAITERGLKEGLETATLAQATVLVIRLNSLVACDGVDADHD